MYEWVVYFRLSDGVVVQTFLAVSTDPVVELQKLGPGYGTQLVRRDSFNSSPGMRWVVVQNQVVEVSDERPEAAAQRADAAARVSLRKRFTAQGMSPVEIQVLLRLPRL